MSIEKAHTKDNIDALEKALQKAEYENSQQAKTIETERERTKAFVQQVNENMQKTKQLEESIAALDEQAKKLHKDFKLNRDNAESLRHTLSVLEQHANALQEKLQASVQETHCKRGRQLQELEKYNAVWSRYEEKYESSTKAKFLAALMKELKAATDRSSMLFSEIEQLGKCVTQLQSKRHQQYWIPLVVKIATVRVETHSILASTRQNWSDIVTCKNNISDLFKKLDQKKAETSKKELEAQSLVTAMSKASSLHPTSSTSCQDNITPNSSKSKENAASSMIKLSINSTTLPTLNERTKGHSPILDIPHTPTMSVPVEIKKITLPSITPIRNKSPFRMNNEATCSTFQIRNNTARVSNLVFTHKSVFPTAEGTTSVALPSTIVAGSEKSHSYILSVPSKAKPVNNSSQFEVLYHHDLAKSNTDIETNTLPSQSPDYVRSVSHLESHTDTSDNYKASPNNNSSGNSTSIDDSNNCAEALNPPTSNNLSTSLQPEFSASLQGSWFDSWGNNTSAIHSDHQQIFSQNLSTNETDNIFSSGFLNQSSECSGFSFLTQQGSTPSESFFCDSSNIQGGDAGFGLSYPFMLQSSETPKSSMFTF